MDNHPESVPLNSVPEELRIFVGFEDETGRDWEERVEAGDLAPQDVLEALAEFQEKMLIEIDAMEGWTPAAEKLIHSSITALRVAACDENCYRYFEFTVTDPQGAKGFKKEATSPAS